MIGVIFHFEDNAQSMQSGRDFDMDTWRQLFRAYNIDYYVVIDKTSDNHLSSWTDNDFEEYVVADMDAALAIHPTHTKVFMAMGGTGIHSYTHPADNVTYIVGSDGSGYNGRDLTNETKVSITYPDSNVELFAQQCIADCLYDRELA